MAPISGCDSIRRMWQTPSRPPNRLRAVMTGCLALLLAFGGHHWIAGLIALVATVLIGMIRDADWPAETKWAVLVWSLFSGAFVSCLFLVTFHGPGLGWHGWQLANTVGIIALCVLNRKLGPAWMRQIITNTPIQIRTR